MPITDVVQFCGQDDNVGSPFNIAVTVAVAAGRTGFVFCDNEDAVALTLTDSKSNTWTKIEDGSNGGAAGTFGTAFLGDIAVALTTSDTLTLTLTAAGNRPTAVGGITWAGGSATVDVEAENTGTGTSMSTGTTATSVSDGIAVAAYAMNDPAAVTPDGAFTESLEQGATGGAGSTPHIEISYKIVSSAATQNSTATRGAGVISWWAYIGVFPASGGGAAAPVLARSFNAIPFMGRMG
jgi:hypothetical protein